MDKKIEYIGYAELIISGILWGSIGMFVLKLDQLGASSAMTSFLRMSSAFLILAFMTIIKYKKAGFTVNKKTILICLLLGLICHGIYNLLYNVAVIKTGITLSAVMLNIAPVFTAIMSRIIFSEHFTKTKISAFIVNITGCILAVTGGKLSLGEISFIGIIFGIGAGFCYSMTAIIGKIGSNNTNVHVMSTYSYLSASVFLLLTTHPFSHGEFNTQILFWGALYGLIPTAIAYLIYYDGVQKLKDTSKVPVFASTETIVATILGIFVYHENIGFINIIGIVLVTLSLLLINKVQNRPG